VNKTIEQDMSDIIGALTDPIIVLPGGWGETLPEWLKSQITLERLVMNMKALKGEQATGTDAEVCAYLYTVSLTEPMDGDWTQIYLYAATQACRRWGISDLPADIAVESLSEHQMDELKDLKDWLYRQRKQARRNKDRPNLPSETVSKVGENPVKNELPKFF